MSIDYLELNGEVARQIALAYLEKVLWRIEDTMDETWKWDTLQEALALIMTEEEFHNWPESNPKFVEKVLNENP